MNDASGRHIVSGDPVFTSISRRRCGSDVFNRGTSCRCPSFQALLSHQVRSAPGELFFRLKPEVEDNRL